MSASEKLDERRWLGVHRSYSIRGTSPLMWQARVDESDRKLDRLSFIPYDMTAREHVLPYKFQRPPDTDVHAEIYRLYPEAQCVLLADLGLSGNIFEKAKGTRGSRPLEFKSPGGPSLYGIAEDNLDLNSLACKLSLILKPKISLLFMGSFGVYTWAKAPIDAVKNLEICEIYCRTFVLKK